MLNKSALKAAIENAMTANLTEPTVDQTNEISALATGIANAIDNYVKGMQITYTAGLANSGGPVTGTFEYQIS